MTGSAAEAAFQASLEGLGLALRARLYARVGSTQDLVLAGARRGAPEGLVVLAEEQVEGRGRAGRTWTAPRGSSLLLSLLLRPRRPPEDWPSLGLMAALCLAEALELVGGPRARIKWPNDLLCGERKLAGVLAERRRAGGVPVLALGVGCNLRFRGLELTPELRRGATACDLEEAPVERLELARALLGRICERYPQWGRGGFSALRPEWLRRAAWVGEEVLLTGPGEPLRGRCLGVSETGALLLLTETGPREVRVGELSAARGSLRRLGDRRRGAAERGD